jgi:hypothetical protein
MAYLLTDFCRMPVQSLQQVRERIDIVDTVPVREDKDF